MGVISAGQLMVTAEQEALAQVFRQAQGPAAGTTYVALATDAGTGVVSSTWTTMAQVTEYGASGYARVPSSGFSGWATPTAASPSAITNTAACTWGPMTSSPGTALTWAFATDATGSGAGGTAKLIAAFRLATSPVPVSGNSVQAAAGTGLVCQV